MIFPNKLCDTIKNQEEIPVTLALPLLLPLVSSDNKLVRKITRFIHYSDEPKCFKFTGVIRSAAELSDGKDYISKGAGYSFFSEDEAFLKCIGDCIVRFCINVYTKRKFTWGYYQELKNKAIDPKGIVSFSDAQRKQADFTDFIIDDSSPFHWVQGYSLSSESPLFLPAQLVYVSYNREPKEKILRFLISTGAASGTCLAGALCRGIYEIIEKDAFMIAWFNRLSCPRVDLKLLRCEKVDHILDSANRYRLQLYTFDITTDLDVPSFLTIIIDKSSVGPAVTVGLESHLNPLTAVVGSMEEAINSRSWIRSAIENDPKLLSKINPTNIANLKERGVFWFSKERIKNVEFLLQQKKKPLREFTHPASLSIGQQLVTLLEMFEKKRYDVLFVDIGLSETKRVGYEVVKVVIPQLHPLSLDERFPYLGGRRLYEVPKILGYRKNNTSEKELYRFPHPYF